MGWIDIVGSAELDSHGVKVGKLRYAGESDVDYRVRLKSAPTTQNRDDGKAAFPVQGTEMHETWYGMTLRDYFAAKAMQGALSACGGKEFADNLRKRCADHGDSIVDTIAEDAYTLADAMLAERAKP